MSDFYMNKTLGWNVLRPLLTFSVILFSRIYLMAAYRIITILKPVINYNYCFNQGFATIN